ncbi:MAG TPA: hypothetical protein VKI44_01030 [Acetobacteraceae bacterium]|nr:hypothetical protein [Acetobacteraceae bacterium]
MAMPLKTQLPPANKILVDREHAQRAFEDAVFAIPTDRSSILVFYGAGGQGTTALCRALMAKASAKVGPSHGLLRRAELDLRDRRTDDTDRLLVWLRNSFADAGVVFPCFDLAFAIAWEVTRGEEPVPKFTKPWLARATKLSEVGVDEVLA